MDLDFDDGDDWLNALSANPKPDSREIFKGSILMNLKLASVKDIDDGATVVSRINEIRRLQQVARNHAEVVAELEEKEAALRQAHAEGQAKDKLILQLQAQLAEQSITSKTQAKAQHADGKMKIDEEGKEDEEEDEDEDEEDSSDESEDENINGEIDAEDVDDSDDEDNSSQESETGETGQHNETAQADAGGGSSGSGS